MKERNENKFYFKGKYFDKSEDYLAFARKWTSEYLSEEVFIQMLEDFKRDVVINLISDKYKIQNATMMKILEEAFFKSIYLREKDDLD